MLLLLAAIVSPSAAFGWADDYADRTPGHQYLQKGARAYENGQYDVARREFVSAARWSDKLAQYNLGAMHYHGHGFDRDSARAWAWFKVSAERNYPLFVDTAEQVWNELDDAQRSRAMAIYEGDVLAEFGDAVTVPRTARHMARDRRKTTGSSLGWAGGLLDVYEVDGPISVDNSSGSIRMMNATRHQGHRYYAEEMWDFEHIMRMESFLFDAEHRGDVTLGDFEIIEDDADRGRDD